MRELPLVCDCNTQDLVDTLPASLPYSSLHRPYDIQMYFTLKFGHPQNIHTRTVGVSPIVPLQIMLVSRHPKVLLPIGLYIIRRLHILG